MAQQKQSKVRLIRSDRSEGIKRGGKDVVKVFNGTFQQDYSILRSDSAYFYPQDNMFDAFGNVNIQQGDTINVYADKLNYNGNTKTAILTNNVRMVDKDATLTTDYLTYNTASKIGTYTGGGKLVNKDNTLTSKNGYYFANSRDAYFRYDVNLNTPDALVKTDTMRYNTTSRISYFYGPTNIYGKAKDKDTLYTENGLYNTITEQAFFGKKNLYKQGTKSLKGDSLFYDRLKGYGRAVKNITFEDKEQKVVLKGDLGTYYKKDERTVVTQNAYVVLVTEEKDSTSTDSTTKKAPLLKTDTLKADSLKMPAFDTVKNTVKAVIPSAKQPLPADIVKKATSSAVINKPAGTPGAVNKKPTTATTTGKKPTVTPPKKPSTKNNGKIPPNKTVYRINEKGERVKVDSVYMSADTLETQIMTYKNLKILQEKRRTANVRDTASRATEKKSIVYKTAPKVLEGVPYKIFWDTTYLHRDFFGFLPAPKVDSATIKKVAQDSVKKKTAADSSARLGNKPGRVDSVYLTTKVKLSDTSRVRLISAYHDAKIFKSDLQAKADSMFYSNADSTIRCYIKPMMWTQGSQLSGDTINLQMKNKKLDNMDIYLNSFIVNVEQNDSTHFNQVGGKKMRGFFRESRLELMYVDGNAESIYFSRDSTTKKISGMERSLSSRMRIRMKSNKVTNLTFLSKPDIKYGPLGKFTEDERILKGFIWKPKERPVSKEVIINSARRKAANRIAAQAEAAAEAKKKAAAAAAEKLKQDTSTAKGKPASATNNPPAVMQQVTPGKKQGAAKDSVINVVPSNSADVNRNRVADGTLNTAPVIMPAVPPVRDTTRNKPPDGNSPAPRDSVTQ
ncbi:hypothetical protein EOD41_05995 [Mucilaginibacter limnophilus]|uniref:Organic solvent tolerance-like N-terminal domain-containing protein n=2 Tax=Mucilaginibacter limnophilus TaxID=1932778 RepID=A0A437MWQ5_9SPHI|nr:hypothetical protein EOD41_05995 [Mucilaginibacter limnophilus]